MSGKMRLPVAMSTIFARLDVWKFGCVASRGGHVTACDDHGAGSFE